MPGLSAARNQKWMLVLTLLITAAMILGGCGNRLSKREYEKRVAAIGKQTDKSLSKLFDSETPPTFAELEQAAEEIEEARSKLEDLSPPKVAERAHKHMVIAMTDFETWISDVAEQMKTATTLAAREKVMGGAAGSTQGHNTVEAFKDAVNEYEAAGYSVFETDK